MALLPDTDRVEVWVQMMNDLSGRREATPFLKDDLRAAIDAADQWVSDNQASFNTALPEPFKSTGSTSQKALVLQFVIQKRFLEGI